MSSPRVFRLFLSFRTRIEYGASFDPESRNVLLPSTSLNAGIFWIPAFAGMTVLTVWMDNRKALARDRLSLPAVAGRW